MNYGSGVFVTQVQMAKVDPPSQVIESFRDVQTRALISNASKMRRRPTPTRSYRRREVALPRSSRRRKAYREQTVAEANGQTARFLKVYDEYKKAPDVTRQRMYLETMERLLRRNRKIILDGGTGVQPFLPFPN